MRRLTSSFIVRRACNDAFHLSIVRGCLGARAGADASTDFSTVGAAARTSRPTSRSEHRWRRSRNGYHCSRRDTWPDYDNEGRTRSPGFYRLVLVREPNPDVIFGPAATVAADLEGRYEIRNCGPATIACPPGSPVTSRWRTGSSDHLSRGEFSTSLRDRPLKLLTSPCHRAERSPVA